MGAWVWQAPVWLNYFGSRKGCLGTPGCAPPAPAGLGADLREAAGLGADVGLHSTPGTIPAQAQAIECWRRLVQSGNYTLVQLSFFAEEIAEGGKRRFLVNTIASFALP